MGSKLPTEGEADAGEAWTLKDAPPRDPLLPTMEHHLDDTDGCSSQVKRNLIPLFLLHSNSEFPQTACVFAS